MKKFRKRSYSAAQRRGHHESVSMFAYFWAALYTRDYFLLYCASECHQLEVLISCVTSPGFRLPPECVGKYLVIYPYWEDVALCSSVKHGFQHGAVSATGLKVYGVKTTKTSIYCSLLFLGLHTDHSNGLKVIVWTGCGVLWWLGH